MGVRCCPANVGMTCAAVGWEDLQLSVENLSQTWLNYSRLVILLPYLPSIRLRAMTDAYESGKLLLIIAAWLLYGPVTQCP
jgi:hypothetical protein